MLGMAENSGHTPPQNVNAKGLQLEVIVPKLLHRSKCAVMRQAHRSFWRTNPYRACLECGWDLMHSMSPASSSAPSARFNVTGEVFHP
jgi:hypothetical protein